MSSKSSILQHKLLTSSGRKTKLALQKGYVEIPKKYAPKTHIYLTWEYEEFVIKGYKNDRRYHKVLQTKSIVEARKILESIAVSKIDSPEPISPILHKQFCLVG
jgi:hypothetical protein